jgi:polysaccharide biosynthesis protein PslG
MTGLLRHRWLLPGVHIVVILGLIASLFITTFHQRYMTRGVSFIPDEQAIPHTDVNPLGVNTFLHEEADPERVDQTLDMIADAGFTWVRQIFVWSDIERAPGEYWDPHQDVSTWDKYDYIMEAAAERGLEVVIRLDKPPAWAQEERGNVDEFPDGPPDDYQDYADFVATVVERYQGQVNYVQLWNEPNLGVEWGGLEVDPEAFTELLAAGYEAVKDVDPDIQVIMPGLAPNDQEGPENLSDLLFLEGMYEAGAADYFDIGAVMVYGYGFSPRDRRVSFGRNNFSRPIQTREIMEDYGDHDKPIWAVEYGWVSLPEDWDGDPSPWGSPVTEEEQAEYLYEGYLRAQREWPWMGAMMVWAFRFPTDPEHEDQAANPTLGFRIVDHDFETRPSYDLLSERSMILDRAYTGTYESDTRYIVHEGDWSRTSRNGSQILQPETGNASLQIPFSGTGIELDLAGEGGVLLATVDDNEFEISEDELNDGSFDIGGLPDGPHVLNLSVMESASDQLSLAGFSVERQVTLSWIYPWIFGVIGLVLLANIGSLAGTILTLRINSSAVDSGRTYQEQNQRRFRGGTDAEGSDTR